MEPSLMKPRPDTRTSSVNTNRLVAVSDLMGVQNLLSVRAHRIICTHEDFPAPAVELASGRVRRRADVEMWACRTGRLSSRWSR